MKGSSEKNGINLLKNGSDREARVHSQLPRRHYGIVITIDRHDCEPIRRQTRCQLPEPQPISRISLAPLGRDRWTKSFVNLVSNRIVLTQLAGCASALKNLSVNLPFETS